MKKINIIVVVTMLSLMVLLSTIASASLTDDLVAYYSFDEDVKRFRELKSHKRKQ